MKKLYISCPITGRDWKDVVKSYKVLKHLACVVFHEDNLEIVNHPKVLDLENTSLSDLAVHVANMSTADYFIGIEYVYGHVNRHCNIEKAIAQDFGMQHALFSLDLVAPDYKDVIRRLESTWSEANVKCCDPPYDL